MNNKLFIPIYMDIHYLAFFFSVIYFQPDKNIYFVEDHLMNTLIKLVPIGPVVSEEKIKMYMLTDDQAAAN
jgi:hypothetical protein